MKKDEYCDEVLDPDRRLTTWKKWVRDRNRESKGLAQKLDRTPADLVMNLTDKFREKKEREYVLAYAQLQKDSKPQDGPGIKRKDSVKGTRKQLTAPGESGDLKPFEHVAVPRYIQKTEKGAAGKPHRKRCGNHDYDSYLKLREAQLDEKIKKIDPFRPSSIDKLFVKGRKPKVCPPPPPPPPDIVIETPVETPECELSAVHAIRVNDTVVCKDVPGQTLTHLKELKALLEPCTSWAYYFKVPVKCGGRCKLIIENLGTVTLRYCWKKIKRYIPLIGHSEPERVFFFNQNEDVLYPGQRREIIFTFLSDKPGTFSEYWELSPCNISFFDTIYEKLIINLHADAVEDVDSDNMKTDTLLWDIGRRCELRTINMLLDDIVTRATAGRPELCPYERMFLERDIFTMKNPLCFYHQTRVEKMKEAFKEMVKGGEWDLSISSWRRAMMTHSFDNRMRFYSILKESYRDLLKPWREGDDVADQKRLTVKSVLGRSIDQFEEELSIIMHTCGVLYEEDIPLQIVFSALKAEHPFLALTIHSIFSMSIRDHLCQAVDTIAGVVKSLDLYRWMNFEVCSC